jgi:hypothetical protein
MNGMYYDIKDECPLWQGFSVTTNIFELVTLAFVFNLLVENVNLWSIFWMILYMLGIWYSTWVFLDQLTLSCGPDIDV